jgi:hypothetical protein
MICLVPQETRIFDLLGNLCDTRKEVLPTSLMLFDARLMQLGCIQEERPLKTVFEAATDAGWSFRFRAGANKIRCSFNHSRHAYDDRQLES